MDDLAKRIEGRFQITTDGLETYVNPIEEHFGTDAAYAQLVKVYRTPKLLRKQHRSSLLPGLRELRVSASRSHVL